MKTKIKIIVTVMIILSFIQVKAQKCNDSTAIVQISFISPLGTNGIYCGKVTNMFSINVFAGFNGGLNGVELGIFHNALKGDMKGLQVSGFGNTVLGTTFGAQIAGFFNSNLKSVKGAQISGFTNLVNDSITGAQVSGFTNFANGSLRGVQVGSFANFAQGISHGAQVSGFANVNNGNLKGLQLSGFANVNTKEVDGSQVSGFSNVNIGSIKGIQLTSYANINTKKVDGAQISGFFNYTRTLKGLQLGIINISDTVESGLPIGFLSYVRKGYHVVEISGSESLFGIASYKTGVEKFYNIFSFGTKTQNNDLFWGFGYGVGSMLPINDKIDINFDAVTYQIIDETWTDEVNVLTKLNLSVSTKVYKNITVFGGLSWNVLETSINEDEENRVFNSLAPWSVYSETKNGYNLQMYPGFTVGIRL